MRRFPDPKPWLFNAHDRKKYQESFWRCPVRLVNDGTWAKLWRTPGTIRGGGAVTSVLPVLALHTWPEKEGATAGWTGWTYLSRRRIAILAGVDKDTATTAITRLRALGLLEIDKRPRAKYEGGYKTDYRLATSLYPQGDERYAQIPGMLFYGGSWFMLPSPACRHLYVMIACLDPIADERAYLNRIAEQTNENWGALGDDEDEAIEDDGKREIAIKAKILAKRRASEPQSISDLVRFSGLQRSTVVKALQVLTTPIFGGADINGVQYPPIALLLKGEASPRTPTWYAPDRRAWVWYWKSDVLNSPAEAERCRWRLWHFL
jgi:hypothetical protein